MSHIRTRDHDKKTCRARPGFWSERNLINKMRFILCVTSYLLLDGWTDLNETLGVYTTRLGLLHGVVFHFRSEHRNRKYGCCRKPEVGTGSWKYSRWKENKILGQKYYSTFLIFWLGEASEASKKIFFPCKSIWASHIKWTPTKNVRIHTGEKRYSCDFCDKRFTDPSSRAKHMLTHPESGAVKCKKCSVFLMSMELEDHMINCKRNYPK